MGVGTGSIFLFEAEAEVFNFDAFEVFLGLFGGWDLRFCFDSVAPDVHGRYRPAANDIITLISLSLYSLHEVPPVCQDRLSVLPLARQPQSLPLPCEDSAVRKHDIFADLTDFSIDMHLVSHLNHSKELSV